MTVQIDPQARRTPTLDSYTRIERCSVDPTFEDPTILKILRQKAVPLVYREDRSVALEVRLPFDLTNRAWLSQGRRKRLDWNKDEHYWSLPASCFSEIAERLLARFGEVFIIQPHNELEKCAPKCWNAKGLECSCSCLGARHGTGQPGGRWYEVSETCAVHWRGARLRWTLLRSSQNA